jgi:hypothetical protein
VVGGAIVGITALSPGSRSAQPACQVADGSLTYTLSLDQAANATTIAAVGKRIGLPDHAVTVAFAAALQESQLHNLPYGDRDSLGLFQQRPSQGWGTPAQVLTPSYAAAAFFQHLAQVGNWANLPVTVAAQQVQRSGAPSAYAVWEGEARALAKAMTGEVAAGLACQHPVTTPSTTAGSLQGAVTTELGSPALGASLPPPRGWTVASWLVGHASKYGITAVAYAGQTWTPDGGHWQPGGTATDQVQFRQATTPTT